MKNCKTCLFLHEMDKEMNWYCCSHPKFFNVHLEEKEDGQWIKYANKHRYFIGNCQGYLENNLKNQDKLFNKIIDELNSID